LISVAVKSYLAKAGAVTGTQFDAGAMACHLAIVSGGRFFPIVISQHNAVGSRQRRACHHEAGFFMGRVFDDQQIAAVVNPVFLFSYQFSEIGW
jgi:hypothetical protein